MKRSTLILLAAGLIAAPVTRAAITSQSKDIIVMQPQDLPELAQIAGQSMQLHDLENGSTYLYIEQQQIGRLAILDVTDPARIKAVGSTKIDTSAPFDFVRKLGDSAVLICFRDNRGAAVVDLRKPKQPTISTADALRQAAHTEEIGDTGFLMMNEPRNNIDVVARDYQVVDASDPRSLRLLTTVLQVQKKLTNGDTGTTYLLGKAGLTVVRRPRVEEQHRLDATAAN